MYYINLGIALTTKHISFILIYSFLARTLIAKQGGLVEIVFVGIDGSGKTTFLKEMRNLLQEHGIEVVRIDVPYFLEVPGFYRLGRMIKWFWGRADEKKNRLFIICLAALSAFLYFPARWKTKNAQIILVERHPRIELFAYANLYSAKWLAKIVDRLRLWWPEPNMAIFLSVRPEVALQRLLMRGNVLQPHETLTQLNDLGIALQKAAMEVPLYHIVEGDGIPPETLAMQCLSLLLENIPEAVKRPSL